MKKAIKIITGIIIALFLVLIVYLKVAVGDKNVYISTGFGSDVMIKVDQTETSRKEVLVYLTDMADEYEELFGSDIWNETIEGVGFMDYVLDQVRSKITRLKCMNNVAVERGIVLSNQEVLNVNKAAEEYYAGISSVSVKKTKITVEDIAAIYRNMVLADKLFADLTYSVDTEISEDEARVITIQYIKTDTLEAAQSIKNQLDAGTSFSSLIKTNNAYEYEYELRRGEMEEAFEEAAFNLVTGQVSSVVQTESGFYIIMCINDYDKAKTASNRTVIVNELKLSMFNELFTPYEAKLYAEYNDKLWEALSASDVMDVSVGLQDTYDKYFAQ